MTTMYKDKEVKELLELLNRHESLTFQSQLDLQKELKVRDLEDNGTSLNATIRQTSSEIENFHYVKDLGFNIEENGNRLTMTRTTRAVLTDLLAIVLGLLLSLVGLASLLSITVFASPNEDDFSIGKVLLLVLYGLMILFGVKFLNGVKRFIDFLGFELSKSDQDIRLRKRFDLKLEERKLEASSLQLVNYKNRVILKVDGRPLLDSNASDLIQKLTIESLYRKLRT